MARRSVVLCVILAACASRTSLDGAVDARAPDARADVGACGTYVTKSCDGGCPQGTLCVTLHEITITTELGCYATSCSGDSRCACVASCVCAPNFPCEPASNGVACEGPP